MAVAQASARASIRKKWLTQWTVSRLWGYLFIAPFMALFLVFKVYPSLYAVWLSFVIWKPRGASQWIGLQNYANLIQNELLQKAFVNTFLYVLMVVPTGIVLSLFTAILIYSLRSNAVRQIFQAAFYLPGVISGLAVVLVWRYIYDPEIGLLNYLLSLVGLPPQNWLGNPNTAMPAVAAMALVGGGGGSVIIFVAALGGIPQELYDAALIDGASNWSKHRYITLPLLVPPTLYVMVSSTISAFQVFAPMMVLTHGGPMNRTLTAGFLIWKLIWSYADLGAASATGVMLLLACIGLTIAQFRWFSQVVEY